jgi:hypothetical protein
MSDLRCDHGILFGVLENGVIEFKCRSSRCGSVKGSVVVIHRFSAETGDLIGTQKFKEPGRSKTNASS